MMWTRCLTGIFVINILTSVYAFSDFDEVIQEFKKQQEDFDKTSLHKAKKEIENGATYDFIVVGSGSGGSVVTGRLSENPNWNVLLLEAGEREDYLSTIPMLVGFVFYSKYNWFYTAEVQENFGWGLQQRRVSWPKGKGIGGSSLINFMLYSRGHKKDFDRWAEAGNEGWSYDDVFPYFLKSENATLEYADYRYHNTSGPLSVQNPYFAPLLDNFLEAGEEMGYPLIDYNSPDTWGFWPVQTTTRSGHRHSAGNAFVLASEDRENLDVLTSARVTKILIDNETLTAQGVQYSYGGELYTAYASKEVVVSAGTFNSPQLLMLSGIGPREHLEELEIPVLKDLPVGQTLIDHAAYPGLFFTLDERSLVITIEDLLNPLNLINYLLTGEGVYSSNGGVNGFGYIKTNVSKEEGDYPDIELIFYSVGFNTDFGIAFRNNYRIADEYFYKYWGPYLLSPTFTIIPQVVHPLSVGYLKLRSKDPFEAPLFYGNYFTDPEGFDMATMIASIRFIIDLVEKTEAFQKVGAKLNPIKVPGCEDYTDNSDEYWECAVRTFSVSIHHQIATNKMGPANDTSAVVDPQLRVYGVQNLRVADCSVVPLPVAGHMNGPCIMVGEKASDLIKASWNGVK